MAHDAPPYAGGDELLVGDWVVNPALNQLTAGDVVVKLEPKAMSVLAYLAERPNQVVSRETLLEALWPGVVVGGDSLTQVVIKLRKALGDAPQKPAYIETISKKGYRLVAPVSRLPRETRPTAIPPVGSRKVRSRLSTAWGVTAGVIAVAFVAMAGWLSSAEYESLARWRYEVTVGPAPARTSQPMVAVTPFEPIGGDSQAVLLAQAMTADLVTDLSKVSGLSVMAVSRPGGLTAGKPSVDEVSVRYFVSGSVQRIEKRLRLHVRLTDAETGKQLWSERYDRELLDLFVLQEELGPKLLQMLPAKLSEAELRRVAHRYTRNLEAYEHFQRGQSALLTRQKEGNDAARDSFRRAIELDAAFARAYAGLALTYAAEFRNQWTADGGAALGRAFELARTAHEMDPDTPEAYWALGFVLLERRQHWEALRHLQKALRLNPSFADAYALMGGIHTYVGDPDKTIPALRTAMRLNPEAGHLYFLLLGRAYFFLGDFEQARVNLENALSRNPENLEAHAYMAALHVMTGEQAAASWKAEEIRTLQPGFSSTRWLETYPMIDAGQRAQLARALGQLGF